MTLGIVLSVLALGLAVGWQILVVGDLPQVTRGLTTLHWTLIVLGSIFFLLLLLGLVLLCAWLVREMRVNQRQEAFLDAVTHEMKTPLASLRLYLETLARHDPSPERRKAFLERMTEDVARLEHTVGEVLAAAREARARPERAEAVDLVELLGGCAAELRARHRLPEEAVRLDLAPGSRAWADPAELQVVFRNLLENAVKYSETPVEVHVAARSGADGRVEVEIRDRGIGIERTELRKIFQRFYRAGRDVQRQAAGLGLGLFIVRNLVRRQGGRVHASSEGEGRGSRFVVSLRSQPRSAAAGPRRRRADAEGVG